MSRDVVVAIFDNRNQAYDAARDINLLGDDVVDVKTGAILEKDRLGNVSTLDTRNVDSAWGTVGGTAVGALAGALIGLLAGPAGAAVGSAAGAAAAGAGAATGGLVGGSLGLSTDLITWGLKQDDIDDIAALLVPGKSALAIEVDEGSTEPIDAAVARDGGAVVYRTQLEI
ncbi:MAG TPA: hypothetical protein VF310_00685 [Vicinamibacteria bacterium]